MQNPFKPFEVYPSEKLPVVSTTEPAKAFPGTFLHYTNGKVMLIYLRQSEAIQKPVKALSDPAPLQEVGDKPKPREKPENKPDTTTQAPASTGKLTLKSAKLLPASKPYYVAVELHRAANVEVFVSGKSVFKAPVGLDNNLRKSVGFSRYLKAGETVVVKAIPYFQAIKDKKEESIELTFKPTGAAVPSQPPIRPTTEKTGPTFPRQFVQGSCFGDVQARTVTYDVNGKWKQLYVDYRVGNCYTSCGNDGRYDAVTDMYITLDTQGARLSSILNDPTAKVTLAEVSSNYPHTTCKYKEEDGKPLQCCALRGAARQAMYWINPNAGRSNGQNTPLKWP